MLRHEMCLLLIASLGCARQPNGTAAGKRHGVPPNSAPSASAQTATPPSTPPSLQSASVAVREVPFDGGVAQVTTDGGSEQVLLVSSDGGVHSESYCEPPLAGYDAVRAFYVDVRAAIIGGNAEQIAGFMAFPLRVNQTGTRVVSTREQFLRERARILTPDVVKRVRDADPGQVFCNSQGEMLGDGVLWAELQPSNRLAVWVVNGGPGPSGHKP